MALTVRLDPRTERLVERLARSRGRGKSEVVREALALLAEREDDAQSSGSPYAAVADLAGCAEGGSRDLSVRTGEKVRALLAARTRKSSRAKR